MRISICGRGLLLFAVKPSLYLFLQHYGSVGEGFYHG